MAAKIDYKGSTIATVAKGGTKILLTQGKYLEGNVTVSDSHAVTLKNSGESIYAFVGYPNHANKYYTSGDTFTFNEGDSLYCYSCSHLYGHSTIYVDGVVVADRADESPAVYNYILPDSDVFVEFSIDSSTYGDTILYITTKHEVTLDTLTATSNNTYTAPSGTAYNSVTVNVAAPTPSLQSKTVNPTESQRQITPDTGYDGLSSVTVNAISSTYVGTGIARKSSTDLTASGATVTVPAGYYGNQASKTIASGSATAPATISGTAATISTGTNTLTLTKTISITPSVTAGYVSSGTAGNSSVSLTASIPTKATATITPGTTAQTIASGTYLTGVQTIAGDSDLIAENIKAGVNIFGVTGNFTADATATASDIISGETAYVNGTKVTGTMVVNNYYTGSTTPNSSLGINGDLYFQTQA